VFGFAGLVAGLVFGLAIGLALGLTLGLTVGLLFGEAAGEYAVAARLFAFTGIFAPQPARFLEWARHAGLVRVSGIAYQFRHDTYQQWLADHHRSA
jgi:hypothetical protein